MNGVLTEKDWKDVVQGFEITDVAIRDRNIVYLCGRKAMSSEEASHLFDGQIPSRIIALYLDDAPGDNYGYQDLGGWSHPVLGVSREPFLRPSALLASMDRDGSTWPFGGGSGPEEQIASGHSPGPSRLKCINGYTYAVCNCRDIYKRVEAGKWIPFRNGIPEMQDTASMPTPKFLKLTSAMGFEDMDAFSDSDMYAVGGHGDVWHFDGTTWKQMGFPSNLTLGTVTCAGDGNVYISGEGGSLWVGQKSTWKRIYKGTSSVLWNDVLWFDGKLWLASDYQLRVWNGTSLEAPEYEGKSVPIAGHMDAYDGILVVAGPHFVMLFDGKSWRNIVAPYLD